MVSANFATLFSLASKKNLSEVRVNIVKCKNIWPLVFYKREFLKFMGMKIYPTYSNL